MIPARLPGVGYGPAPKAAGKASALALPPRLVVIHDTSNTATAAAEAHYAATRADAQANWTSCHFYVDPTAPLGSTPLNVQAWAAYSYANQHGWHIEMCGRNAGQPGAVPASTIAATARLVAQLCALAGIPKVHLGPADVAAGKRGITGHWDITQGLHVGTHDDPGPAFNWSAFIAAVNTATVNNTAPEVHDMNLSDKLPGTDNASRSVGDYFADDENLRNWWVSPVGQATKGVPLAGSPLDLLVKHLQAGAVPVDVDALAGKIAAQLIASGANGLTPADHAAIVADVKAALRDGTG
jgi:N-acetyl-anhydromuramyl-L-alanine amidase AmpD